MRFHVGIPELNRSFPMPGQGWVRLSDRHAWTEVATGTLLWALLALFVLAWSWASPSGWHLWQGLRGWQAVALVPGMFVVHESLHALCYPDGGLSSRTIVGVLPQELGFFAMYDGERSKARTIVAKTCPFMVLSVLPLLVGLAHGVEVPAWLRILSTLNGALCAGDLVAIWHVVRGVPNGSILRPSSTHVWYRPRPTGRMGRAG